jgi:hypothetical protein
MKTAARSLAARTISNGAAPGSTPRGGPDHGGGGGCGSRAGAGAGGSKNPSDIARRYTARHAAPRDGRFRSPRTRAARWTLLVVLLSAPVVLAGCGSAGDARRSAHSTVSPRRGHCQRGGQHPASRRLVVGEAGRCRSTGEEALRARSCYLDIVSGGAEPSLPYVLGGSVQRAPGARGSRLAGYDPAVCGALLRSPSGRFVIIRRLTGRLARARGAGPLHGHAVCVPIPRLQPGMGSR